jgi:hypothetical protein
LYFRFIYHHPPQRDNVTAPHGRPNLRNRLHFGHNREGIPRCPYGTCGDIREKEYIKDILCFTSYNNNNKTKYYATKILKTETDSKCRLCHQFDETIDHIISACPILAKE